MRACPRVWFGVLQVVGDFVVSSRLLGLVLLVEFDLRVSCV